MSRLARFRPAPKDDLSHRIARGLLVACLAVLTWLAFLPALLLWLEGW